MTSRRRSERRHPRRRRRVEIPPMPMGDLPAVMTDPGCDGPTHVPEVMGAAMAWQMGARWLLPRVMDCGCRIVAMGDDAWRECS